MVQALQVTTHSSQSPPIIVYALLHILAPNSCVLICYLLRLTSKPLKDFPLHCANPIPVPIPISITDLPRLSCASLSLLRHSISEKARYRIHRFHTLVLTPIPLTSSNNARCAPCACMNAQDRSHAKERKAGTSPASFLLAGLAIFPAPKVPLAARE